VIATVSATLPVKPPEGAIVIVEAFPLVAPGRILTVVPLIVKARAITVTIFVPAALV
jgi:hypothetical protein